jgi:hypothetical protein
MFWLYRAIVRGLCINPLMISVNILTHCFSYVADIGKYTDLRPLHLKLPYKHVYAVYSESNYVGL